MLISAAVLSMIVGVQTAMAQKIKLYTTDNKTIEYNIAQLDSIVFVEEEQQNSEEIVVTVDANGNADDGHQFMRIDEATFLIDDLKYEYKNGGLTVIGYDPVFFTGTATVISKLIYNGQTMNVVGINGSAFRDCTSLTSITIPISVTSIGEYAFYRCTSLTSITIPESVTRIGGSAFAGCSSLTSITIGSGVTSIGYDAFYVCSSLTSIIVDNGNTVYDSRNNCNAIIETATNTLIAGCKNTIIPENVTSIGYCGFYGCSSLTSVTIPNSVTSISDNAFRGCSSLTSITIPNSVTSIGNYAFYGCRSLTSITIGSGLTSIGESTFSDCRSLTDVFCYAENVPNTGSYVFYNSPISSATLHVPAGSMNSYKAEYPWKEFGSIVAIE